MSKPTLIAVLAVLLLAVPVATGCVVDEGLGDVTPEIDENAEINPHINSNDVAGCRIEESVDQWNWYYLAESTDGAQCVSWCNHCGQGQLSASGNACRVHLFDHTPAHIGTCQYYSSI